MGALHALTASLGCAPKASSYVLATLDRLKPGFHAVAAQHPEEFLSALR